MELTFVRSKIIVIKLVELSSVELMVCGAIYSLLTLICLWCYLFTFNTIILQMDGSEIVVEGPRCSLRSRKVCIYCHLFCPVCEALDFR